MENKNVLLDYNELCSQMSHVSLEDSWYTNIPDLMYGKIKNVRNYFNDLIEKVEYSVIGMDIEEAKDLADFYKRLNTLLKDSNVSNISAIENIKIPVVVGIKVNYLTINKELEKAFDLINSKLKDNTDKAIQMLSKIVVDDDFKKSKREIMKNNKDFSNSIAELEKIQTTIIDPKNLTDTRKIGEMLPNLSSLGKVIEDSFNINKKIDLNIIDNMLDAIKKAKSLTTILLENSDKKFSKEILYTAEEIVYSLARFTTLSANMIYVYKTNLKSITHIEKVLKNLK